MTRRILIAILTTAILAGCMKDEATPSVQPMSSFLVVTVENSVSNDFRLLKYEFNGVAGDMFFNQRFPNNSSAGYPDLTGTGDKIVYTGHDSIFVMNVSSKTSSFIYKNADSRIQFPTISRDGTKIAFSAYSNGGADADIFVMDAIAGATPVNITRNESGYSSMFPSFSADATRITFTIGNDDGEAVYVSDLQGNGKVRVSGAHSSGEVDLLPVFSPDGNNLIYSSSKYSVNDPVIDILVSTALEGAEDASVRLTTSGVDEKLMYSLFPTISKDGQTVYFIGADSWGNTGIYKVPYFGGVVTSAVRFTLGANDEIVGLHFVEQ